MKVSVLFSFLIMLSSFEKDTEGVQQHSLKHLVPAPCPAGHFPCNSSAYCVEQRRNCDDTEDCPDGSDEWHCEDHRRKDFWERLFKKRPDEDREKKMANCDLWDLPDECNCSRSSIFCDHRGLTRVPENLSKDAQELDLSGNKLHILQASDFPRMEKLSTLILTSSEVTLVHPRAFQNLVNLQSLYFTNNRITALANGTFETNSNLKLLVLSHNPLSVVSQGVFTGLSEMEEIDLKDCRLRTIPEGLFENLFKLKVLWLDGNQLDILPKFAFQHLRNLQILSLSRNQLQSLEATIFYGLHQLKSLAVAKNRLIRLDSRTFGNMSTLLKLDLQSNEIRSIERDTFSTMSSLESLNLKNLPLREIEAGTFEDLTNLNYIYFDEFHFCSLALHVRVCEPRSDGISSIAHLLDSVVLRVSVWLVACIASVGNLSVLVGRLLFFSEPNEVHSFYIKNLSLADLLMAVYLFVIAAYDVAFRGQYIKHETGWRHSWQCNFCGFLSTLSSESSVLILTMITIDRYTSVLYPLTLKRRSIASASGAMISVWSIAIILSALPMLNISYFDEEFYGNNGVCLPLQIHDPYGKAWEYSTFLFCGVNLAAFLFILFAYTSMFFTISHSRIGLRSTQQVQDRAIAKRFAFIVGTDFLCWVPIVLIKVMALSGLEIQQDLYAWVAVFLLPVNSALNPVLYTLTTKLFKQQLAKIVYSCRTTSGAASDNSGTSLTSTLHKSSKKTLLTTFSENDHCGSKTTLSGERPMTNKPYLKTWRSSRPSEQLL